MKTCCDVTALTATGDTTETLVGTITLPANAKRIIGIGCYACAAAAITTAEGVTGIYRVRSDDLNFEPSKWPLDVIQVLTSGAVAFSPRVFGVSIDTGGVKAVVEFLVTMDMAQTGALKARGVLVMEVG